MYYTPEKKQALIRQLKMQEQMWLLQLKDIEDMDSFFEQHGTTATLDFKEKCNTMKSRTKYHLYLTQSFKDELEK